VRHDLQERQLAVVVGAGDSEQFDRVAPQICARITIGGHFAGDACCHE
jgi:hypothetical protein